LFGIVFTSKNLTRENAGKYNLFGLKENLVLFIIPHPASYGKIMENN
jgi:hypothetical protein